MYVNSLCPLFKTFKFYLLFPPYCLFFFSRATLKAIPPPFFWGHFEMLLQCVTKANFFLVFYLHFIICVSKIFFRIDS